MISAGCIAEIGLATSWRQLTRTAKRFHEWAVYPPVKDIQKASFEVAVTDVPRPPRPRETELEDFPGDTEVHREQDVPSRLPLKPDTGGEDMIEPQNEMMRVQLSYQHYRGCDAMVE